MPPASIPEVWRNQTIPVIYRPDTTGPLKLRLPYREGGNRQFLKSIKERRTEPVWDSKDQFWSVPKNWFTGLVESVVLAFGSAWVIQPHHAEERCSASCRNARRLECECSCLGENHGAGGRADNAVGIQGAVVLPWRTGLLTVQFFKKREG